MTTDFDENLFALFAQQAARRPEAAAVIGDASAMSYGELLARACVIADVLIQRGLGAEQPVGVLMKRTPDLLATLLGILGAGGCYVPLDPEDPPERTRRMLDGARCRLVLGHQVLLDEFRSRLGSVELVGVERFATSAADPSPRLPNPPAPGGQRLAYILFTSGSTGAPKGVEIEHRNAVSLALAGRDLFRFTESDRWLATSTIAFDLSVAELFIPLVTGGAVVLRDRRLLQDPHGLVKVIREQGVTMFQTVPSVWSVLLSEIPDFPRIRIIATTGEAAPNDLARRLIDVADEVWNLYGPTETTVWATGHRLQKNGTVSLSAAAPIGRPLANVEVRILDEHRVPVPAGREGELWIGGTGLARGYCGNEQLTREKFAVLEQDGRRFYRTGDVVVADGEGTLHYFGRCDDQMKVRGVRIEPMEVEAAILACPGVAKAAATWYATASGSRSIVAAVVAGPGQTLNAEDLHGLLVPALPSAMVPSRFVFCDTLPMTPSGKVDRKAIRARVADQPVDHAAASGQHAASETERTLIGIWQRTLNIRPVSRGDHFFTIGGDSLSAVTMMLEVEATFGITLAFRVAFEAPTLDRLAERIDRARARELSKKRSPQQTDDPGKAAFVFPLAQQGRGTPVFFNGVDIRMAQDGMWDLDCPLYAVSQWAPGVGFLGGDTIEELARRQLAGIRTIQAAGPYRIAGYSYGGLLALEIAQQLRAAGDEVEFLFLLDPMQPRRTALHPGDYEVEGLESAPEESRARRWGRHLTTLLTRPRHIVHLSERFLWHAAHHPLGQRITYGIVHLHGRRPNAVSRWLLPRNRWPAFWYSARRMARTYEARPYEGRVLAVFAQEGLRREVWRDVLPPDAGIHVIPVDHDAMVGEPALSQWIRALRVFIGKEC